MSMLAGKFAVVTGAISGIGRAIALSFAQEGAAVGIAGLTPTPLEGSEPTLDLILRAGNSGFFRLTDVAAWEDIDAVVGEAVARFGRLDIMVNNAAVFSGTPLLDTTAEQWERAMAVNMTGMFQGCKRAV